MREANHHRRAWWRRARLAWAGAFALAAALGVLAGSCATQGWHGFPPGYDAAHVWPDPPEAPRVAFVLQIRAQEDLFQSGGFWPALRDFVVGKADTTLSRPFALALAPGGGLLVTDPGRRRVHFYDWSRGRYVAIGDKMEGGLPSPVGVAALPDGRILVSDSRLTSIECFDRDGKRLAPFCKAGVLSRPAGLAVGAARGEVYAADVTGQRIAVFDFDGRLLRSIGKHGGGDGELNFPTFIALDPQGRLVVTDSMNFRMQVLTPQGDFVRAMGSLGDAPGRFDKPKGVAVDGAGDIIAVEGLHDALQFFDDQGRLLLSLGSSGGEPGQFWLPAGLCFDPAEGLLFVADSYNGRVQVFRMLGVGTPPMQTGGSS